MTKYINDKNSIFIMKNILVVIILILSFSMISAEIQTLGFFKQDSCVILKQTCSNCTYSNITSINIEGNSKELLSNAAMTKKGYEYNYTFCNTSELGEYIVNGVSNVDSYETVWAYDFIITPTGKELTSQKTSIYIFIFIFSFVVFLGLLILGFSISGKNERDEMTGYIIAVSNLKYFKLLCLGIAYVFFVFITYFAWMMTYAFLEFNFLSSIMQWVFYVFAVLTLPLFILFTYLTITNLIKDKKIGEALAYGIKIK